MTIKELEERTGLSRANIRFYEQEDLLSPRRLPNGYRDYSEAELTTLLRIKLLRELEVPLEEIRQLIRGDAPLAELMDRHAASLAQEGLRLAAAREVCEDIRRSGLPYSGLDPAPYLRRLSQGPAPRQDAPAVDRLNPCPWRRLFARYMDLTLYAAVFQVLAILLLRRSCTGLGWELLFAVLALATMLFLEPLLLSRWGTTPGKWAMDLRVEALGGGPVSYAAGLDRTFAAITQGMGLQIPLYRLFKLYHSYKLCVDEGLLPWEIEGGVVVARKQRPLQVVRFLAFHAALLAVLVAALLSLTLPPNRGALTAAEYAENFNYYMVRSQQDYRLTGEGTLVHAQEDPYTFYFHLDGDLTQCLRFTFEEEDGLLRGVTADYLYRCTGKEEGSIDMVCLPGQTFQYAFLAAAGADASLFRIRSLLRASEEFREARAQVTYRDLTARLTVEQSGYTAQEDPDVYIAYDPDETCWIRARMTLSLP